MVMVAGMPLSLVGQSLGKWVVQDSRQMPQESSDVMAVGHVDIRPLRKKAFWLACGSGSWEHMMCVGVRLEDEYTQMCEKWV
jgi:hypothetical protein